MDHCIWSVLPAEIQSKRSQMGNAEDLKNCHLAAWKAIPLSVSIESSKMFRCRRSTFQVHLPKLILHQCGVDPKRIASLPAQ